MSTLGYRVPGYPSGLSLSYFASLRDAGWAEEDISPLQTEIPKFESACVTEAFDDALDIFTRPDAWNCHRDFLKRLHRHVRIVTRALIAEELHRKATTKERDSLAAAELLHRIDGRIDAAQDSPAGEIHFTVQDAVKGVRITHGQE